MTRDNDLRTSKSINRRNLMKGLAATGGVMFAGCIGDDDEVADDDDTDVELGEQVPTVQFVFPTGLGATSEEIEEVTRIITENFEEHLGIETETDPVEMLTMYTNIYNEERDAHFWVDGTLSGPQDYDPYNIMRESHILWAGANGLPNHANYANCEFSELVEEMQKIADPDERAETIREAFSVASHDIERIPLHPSVDRVAWNTNYVDLGDWGEMGIEGHNLDLWFDTEAVGDENTFVLASCPACIPGKDFPSASEVTIIDYLGRMVNASPIYLTKDFEIEPLLASDFDFSEDATEFTFTLRDDAQFHNGDPVLAEDMVWTYEYLQENHEEFPYVIDVPYESIEATDDHRVEIQLSEPFAGFIEQHAVVWGILHKDVWIEGGAEDTPDDVEWDYIGSGAWEVDDFAHREMLQLIPNEDFHRPPNSGIIYDAYDDSEAEARAFEQETLHYFGPSGGVFEDVREQDHVETYLGNLMTDRWLAPQHAISPTQFVEFREAAARVIDRSLLLELGTYGHGEPHFHSAIFNWTHPHYPDDPDETLKRLADDVEPDPDTAHEILEDAGWGWDDDGNLRYPADKDLSPLWPDGSEPAEHPDDFPCVDDLEMP